MTVAAQQPGEPSDHAGRVIHNEDRLPMDTLVYLLLWSRRRGHGGIANWQLDLEYCALSWLTRDPDSAAMPSIILWHRDRPRPVPTPGGLVVKKGSKMRVRSA